jgi:hypothetical protein
VFTQGVDGITDMDLKMMELLDAVPANYSIYWRKQNADLFDKLDTGRPELSHGAHSQSVAAPLGAAGASAQQLSHQRSLHGAGEGIFPQSTSRGSSNSGVHSSHSDTLRNDGTRLHSHSFRVQGHHAPLGDSEVKHHMEHLHEFNDSNHIRMNLRGTSPDELKRGFALMVRGLETYQRLGYDVGLCEEFLPMLEHNTVIPGYSEDLQKAYKHIKQRGSKDWADNEPREIVDATEEFVQGYALISKVYLNLAEPAV